MPVTASLCIWYGIVVGILDILSDVFYLATADFATSSLRNAVLAFCLL